MEHKINELAPGLYEMGDNLEQHWIMLTTDEMLELAHLLIKTYRRDKEKEKMGL